MKENKDCKIVQDLLPNYIENLTNKETNEFIEEHIKECGNCKNVLENMKKNLELNTSKRDDREVKYIKKYNRKMRLLKFIILLILLVFISSIIRKIIIISKLSNTANSIIDATNFHRTITSYNPNIFQKTDIYKLNDKMKIYRTVVEYDKLEKTIIIAKKVSTDSDGFDSYLINEYTENSEGKTARLNRKMGISTNPQNPLYVENSKQLLLYSAISSVKQLNYNGEECYKISNFNGLYFPGVSDDSDVYIEKETGLTVAIIGGGYGEFKGDLGKGETVNYTYEFNTVTEDDFVEPNISEYTIVEEVEE